jgi:hypothetical protein
MIPFIEIQRAIQATGKKCYRRELYAMKNLPRPDVHVQGRIRLYSLRKAEKIAQLWAIYRKTTLPINVVKNYLKSVDKL